MRIMGAAIRWARAHMRWAAGFCLQWVRSCFDVAPKWPDAATGWRNARFKHPTNDGDHVPRGAPCWWVGGSRGFGHVALGVGNGYCLSTDAGGSGVCAKVKINELTRRWGLDFVGWSEDINGVKVFSTRVDKPAAGWNRVRISALDRGEHNKDIEVVKRRLFHKMGNPHNMALDGKYADHWGAPVTKTYAAWQRRLGFTGDDADGRPGRYSLRKLDLEVVPD